MIKINYFYLLIFSFTIHSTIYSQNKSLIISVGTNVIDDTFTANYKPFNISEQWNVGKTPSYLSISSELTDRTYIGFSITSNKYKTGKLVNGSILLTDKNYFSIDFLANYKLLNPNNNFYLTHL